MSKQERIEALERLATDYYTLLRVINKEHWQRAMTPFWNRQKDKLQARAEQLGITDIQKSEPSMEEQAE